MDNELSTLSREGLQQFQSLRDRATSAVSDRFFVEHAAIYERLGAQGRDTCKEDLGFHLEFLGPVLEFGALQPMVSYLSWLDSLLVARGIPSEQLAISLDWLAEFFHEHMAPAPGFTVAASLAAAKRAYLAARGGPSMPLQGPEAWPDAGPFEAALLEGNQRAAVSLLEDCLDRGCSLVDFELHVIQPLLYRIGEKWQSNVVTVAQEHMATAMVHSVMTVGLLRSTKTPVPRNKRVLLACVEGNHHAVGLRMVADAFQLDGFDVQYLGSNVPTKALVQQAADWKADLVGLSVSFPQQLRMARLVIEKLADRLGDARPAVLVGGLAINRFSELCSVVGADATCVDAGAAAAFGRRLPA